MSDARTGAQINAHLNDMLKTVSQLTEAFKLRQWSVEQTRLMASIPGSTFTPDRFMEYVERIHRFLQQPALDAIAQIEAAKIA